MSTITLPAQFIPRTCQLELETFQRVNAAPFGGSEQAVDLLNDRWRMVVALPGSTRLTVGAWAEAFRGNLRGQVNVVALRHFTRPQPRGTARGTMTLNASASQGASSIVVTGVSPATGTLLAGDMLGVGGLLLMVGADCTAVAGLVTVPLVNRLRAAQSGGAAVTWDAPTALFRLVSGGVVAYGPRSVTVDAYEFVEAI